MSVLDKFWIKLFCTKIGHDEFNNQYYIGKSKNYLGINKRYVIYNGLEDGSKIPQMWHSWLHYLSKEIPSVLTSTKYQWQQKHLPNLSGTKAAHRPDLSNYIKIKTYTSWKQK